MSIATRILLAAAFLAAGCGDDNPNVCEATPENCVLDDAGPDRECTDNGDCTDPSRPVCDTDTSRCIGCRNHADCESQACTPEGACAAEADVAYVSSNGAPAETACARATPCATINAALATGKTTVKVEAGTITDTAQTTIAGSVTILADPGAILDRNGDGVNLAVMDGTVRIFDLTIAGATGLAAGIGISVPAGSAVTLTLQRVTVRENQGLGIEIDAGHLTLSQSRVIGNIGGGLRILMATFDITNNFIIENGSPGLNSPGGVVLLQTSTDPRRFEFNTVAHNGSGEVNGVAGILCVGIDSGRPMRLANNIVFDNTSMDATPVQVGDDPDCTYEFSNIGPEPQAGTMNFATDPMFVDPTLTDDYRLTAGSPAIDTADPDATITDDIDGDDTRPTGTGDRRDVGADERGEP